MKKMFIIALAFTFVIGSTTVAFAHHGGYYNSGYHNHNNDVNWGTVIGLVAAVVIVDAIANNNQPQVVVQQSPYVAAPVVSPVLVAQGAMPCGGVTTVELQRGQFGDITYNNGRTIREYGPVRAFNVVRYYIYQQ